VPLSEEELRLLEQMERALVAEDPKLASTLRGTTLRATARRRALLAAGMFVVGVVVLMTGAVTKNTVVGIIGFVVMLASAYFALTFWRNQNRAPDQSTSSRSAHPSFSVIEGGRSKRRSGKARSPRSRQSMMERFEERWRRRRDQNGY
jgi:predicted lipid-binding transport protein (Tim44 family)